MRKVTVELKLRLIINADEGMEIGTIIDEMDYDFTYNFGLADIKDIEILDYEIIDSK